MIGTRRTMSLAICGALVETLAYAQVSLPRVEVTAVPASIRVLAGTEVLAAIRVRLPPGVHVNSNTPNNSSLIPTVLSVDASSSISVTEITYPKSIEFRQRASSLVLDVYERDFRIGFRVRVARTREPGVVRLNTRLRYQACDDSLCYPPRTISTPMTFRIVPLPLPPLAPTARPIRF
jgi:DsbC/DsbD-like thiol-disulfide interchange protein